MEICDRYRQAKHMYNLLIDREDPKHIYQWTVFTINNKQQQLKKNGNEISRIYNN